MDLAERLRAGIATFASQNDQSAGGSDQETGSNQSSGHDDEGGDDHAMQIEDLLRLEEDDNSTELDDDGEEQEEDSQDFGIDNAQPSILSEVSTSRSHKDIWKKSNSSFPCSFFSSLFQTLKLDASKMLCVKPPVRAPTREGALA